MKGTKPKQTQKAKGTSRLRRLFDTLIAPILVGAGTWFLVNVIFLIMLVPTGSMEPGIRAHSLCFGLRIAYAFEAPERGDIVVFQHKETGKLMVKRLIGLPGDHIELNEHVLLLNGEAYREPYVREVPDYESIVFDVPDGHYLFLGDNRNFSLDARSWENPYIPSDDIIAKNLIDINLPTKNR